MVAAGVYIALLVVSAVLTTALGIYAYRHRDEPGASAFVALMAILTNWSAVYAIGLVTTDEFWRIVWLRAVWFSTGTIEVWLLLFALAYTGHDEFINRKTVATLLVVPATVIFATWTNPLHNLFWTEHNIVQSGGLVLVDPSWGVLFWVEVIYTYLLVAVASALLIRLIYQSDYLFTDQSVLLLVGIATPFVASATDVFVLSDQPAIDPTPFAFTVTGVAFAYALFRRQLFDLVPATRQLGRNAAISQLDAGVVIVDNANRIVYCNTAAEEVLDCDAADAVGRDVELLVDESRLDFDTDDALAEVERDGDTYEIRTSPITDRRGRRIGNTLVVHDVTARKEREQRLARQRDELETVNDLNAVIRGVNQALVSALSREEIEETVCEKIAAADLYRTAAIADMPTWSGEADRWTTAGDADASGGDGPPAPPAVEGELGPDDGDAATNLAADAQSGTWSVVPLVYGRTVYGALGLYTDRESVSDRERSVLGELGESIGHAINAVETRQLLSAESVVELELELDDDSDPLVAAATAADCRFDLEGLVPAGEDGPVAYLLVAGTDTEAAREALDGVATGAVRTIREGEDGLLEWRVTGDAPLGTLVDHGASVTEVRADGGRARYDLAIASASNVRSLVDHLGEQFDGARVLSKRERTRAVEDAGELPGDGFDDLTDRQREVLDAAYRAGYFEWPRDSNAEEVAETLDISSATLHSHLRKAEGSILADMFDTDEGP